MSETIPREPNEGKPWGWLDPIARVSEVLFGLIMALTFTGTLSVVEAGREEVRTMLVGAIGCNIAWGLVDAVMYLMTRLTERGRDLHAVRSVREAMDPAQGRRIIAEALPPLVAANLPDEALETLRLRLNGMPGLPRGPRLARADYLGAVGVFLLVVVSTLPVVAPFVVMSSPVPALRISNAIAVLMMFACGYRLGRYGQHRPLITGVAMALIGCVLVALTIALGG
jgi:hypothetical protein